MIVLGNVDSNQVKEDFLKKFHAFRDDADEYKFGVIKGEKMSTTVYHKPCKRVFESRPYLFIQEDWAKKCPYCYSDRIVRLTTDDVVDRVNQFNPRMKVTNHVEKYIRRQKIHQVYLECLDCHFEFSRNLQNLEEGFLCPSCKNLK